MSALKSLFKELKLQASSILKSIFPELNNMGWWALARLLGLTIGISWLIVTMVSLGFQGILENLYYAIVMIIMIIWTLLYCFGSLFLVLIGYPATFYIVSSLNRFFEQYLGMQPDSWISDVWKLSLIPPFAFSVYVAILFGMMWPLMEFGLLLIEALSLENNLASASPSYDSLGFFPLYFLPDIF